MSVVHIIFTTRYEQFMAFIEVSRDLKDDYKFLASVFSEFENKDELAALIKMSCCQLLAKDEEMFPFLKDRDGKYFFNDDLNMDEDTKNLRKFRDNFVHST